MADRWVDEDYLKQTEMKDPLYELEKLLARTQSSIDLEEHINDSILVHKRISLIACLRALMQKLEEMAAKTVRRESVKPEDLIVQSQYHFWTKRGKQVEGYLATIISDTMIQGIVSQWGPIQIAHFDNPDRGITYLLEYRERFNSLIEKLEEGELDTIVDYPPHSVLHMINGAHGELLKELGVNPANSSTVKRLVEQELSRLIVVELLDSVGVGINGATVEYYQKRWRPLLEKTGEMYKDGWLSGLTYEVSENLRVRINYMGNLFEKSQNLNEDRTVIFQTKRVEVSIRESNGVKGVSDAQVLVKIGDSILREAYTDEKGEAFFELFPGEYSVEISRDKVSLKKPIQLTENMVINIRKGTIHSKSGKHSPFYHEV